MKIIVQPTEIAHWHALLAEAQATVECPLEEEVESYLVYLLMRFNTFSELNDSVLAVDFFKAHQAKGRARAEILQHLGDKSLIFSGFFPEQANQRNVTLDYFIEMGQSAYHSVGLFRDEEKGLFFSLSEGFISMISVLNLVKGNVPVSINKN